MDFRRLAKAVFNLGKLRATNFARVGLISSHASKHIRNCEKYFLITKPSKALAIRRTSAKFESDTDRPDLTWHFLLAIDLSVPLLLDGYAVRPRRSRTKRGVELQVEAAIECELVLADPSPKTRWNAAHMLSWYGPSCSTHMLSPLGCNAVRKRLFEMVIGDPHRKQSAFALLGQIEVWRLEQGHSADEPRHPVIESEVSWPPFLP
jgi:hypothetical protein